MRESIERRNKRIHNRQVRLDKDIKLFALREGFKALDSTPVNYGRAAMCFWRAGLMQHYRACKACKEAV